MFGFFSSKLGCLGSIIVSIIGTLILLAVLRGCNGRSRMRTVWQNDQRLASRTTFGDFINVEGFPFSGLWSGTRSADGAGGHPIF